MDENSQTDDRLSVLQVVRPAAGGIRRHVSLLCRGLAERGITVEAAVPPRFALEGRDPVRVNHVPISARHHLARDVKAAISVAHLARRFDVMHGHGMRAAWICYLASRRTHKPFVFTAHNLAPALTGQLAPRLVRTTVRAASARIAVSQAVVESFRPLGILTAEWTVVSNGVDLEAFDHPPERASVFRSLGLPEDAQLVVSVGRLAPEKGFDILIETARLVTKANKKVYFALAGDGPLHDKLADLAKPLGKRFLLLGRYNAVYGLVSASDVIAIPSIGEGQGLVALEAMAAGKPVVASAAGGLAETVADGQTGLIVPDGSPEGLADSLKRLLADSGLRSRMGESGRSRAAEQYSLDKMVDKTLAVYSAVCSGGFVPA
jgi:glycosyltransferase involved in cell wall biosynthesis